jgi:hypothetical protein
VSSPPLPPLRRPSASTPTAPYREVFAHDSGAPPQRCQVPSRPPLEPEVRGPNVLGPKMCQAPPRRRCQVPSHSVPRLWRALPVPSRAACRADSDVPGTFLGCFSRAEGRAWSGGAFRLLLLGRHGGLCRSRGPKPFHDRWVQGSTLSGSTRLPFRETLNHTPGSILLGGAKRFLVETNRPGGRHVLVASQAKPSSPTPSSRSVGAAEAGLAAMAPPKPAASRRVHLERAPRACHAFGNWS